MKLDCKKDALIYVSINSPAFPVLHKFWMTFDYILRCLQYDEDCFKAQSTYPYQENTWFLMLPDPAQY